MNEPWIQERYLRKKQSAERRGIAWNLGLKEFCDLIFRKHCFYTGLTMTRGVGKKIRPFDRTIDRVDHTKPYEHGNVVACCRWVNDLKGVMEGNPNSDIGPETLRVLADKFERVLPDSKDSIEAILSRKRNAKG